MVWSAPALHARVTIERTQVRGQTGRTHVDVQHASESARQHRRYRQRTVNERSGDRPRTSHRALPNGPHRDAGELRYFLDGYVRHFLCFDSFLFRPRDLGRLSPEGLFGQGHDALVIHEAAKAVVAHQ